MAFIQPDFSEVERPIPAGHYMFTIQNSQAKSSDKGTQYVAWLLATEGDQFKLVYNTPITGKGANMFKHFVHAAGDESFEDGGYDTARLHGRKVMCEVVEEKYSYNGRDGVRPKVKEVRKVDPEQGSFNEADLPF